MRRRAMVLVLFVAVMSLLAFAAEAQAGTIEVTTTADPAVSSCPGPECSLREAVAVSEEGEVIKLAGSSASPDEYKLTQGSQIVVSTSLTITGDGTDASIIDGASNLNGERVNERIMKVVGGIVRIEGVKFVNGIDGVDEGLEGCNPCFTINGRGGGAIYNAAVVELENVIFEDDGVFSGQPTGGAIGNAGTLDLTNVAFPKDGAAIGGALFSRGGTINADGVSFENDGSIASEGGAVFLIGGGSATFTNTTVVNSGASNSFGGGIDNRGSTLTLDNDTLSGNIRGSLETDVGASTSVQNTILGEGFSDGSDYACIAAGKPTEDNGETAKAITTDLGNNIDQDGALGACELTAAGDKPGLDPKLVSIADNGGPVRTQALLHGSPAIDSGNDAGCPASDARGITRPQGTHCDIGAFEAVLLGPPSATTESSRGVTAATATLEAKINLTGEAGGFHFLLGTSVSELKEETPEVAAGVLSNETLESEPISGLNANTTYFYKAVADNASASAPASNVKSFTTLEAAPEISEISASVTETTATIHFDINPGGAATEYRIEYGPSESYGQHTEFLHAGAASTPQSEEAALTGLEMNKTYHFDVVAKNSVAPGGVNSEDRQFTTEPEGGSPKAPEISEVFVSPVGETTATIHLTIDPHNSDTEYRIEYGINQDNEQDTEFTDIGSTSTPHHLEVTLTELQPQTTYHFVVEAENTQTDGGVFSEEKEFTTASEAGPPLVSEVKLASTTPTSATIEFSIDPAGADTTYVIKYGSGSAPTQETAPVDIGATPGFQPITRTLTGLEAGKSYNVEVVATNAKDKATSASRQFTTEALLGGGSAGPLGALTNNTLVAQGGGPPPLPSPVLGKTANVELVSGTVLIALPVSGHASRTDSSGTAQESVSKGLHFVPLTEARQIPVGSTLDTTAGIARIQTATASAGKLQFGDFGAGLFKLLQDRNQKGLTQLNLIDNLSRRTTCASIGKGKRASVAKHLSSKVLGQLNSTDHGKFATRGQYSAATVRGTEYSVKDTCAGTLTKVTRGVVAVRDFRKRKTITLRSGKSYLAKALG